MVARLLCLILFAMAALPLCAQTATVAGGGSNTTTAGFISVSIGQTADGYAVDGNWYDGQGVQQPYCNTRFDTLVAAVCQHQPYTNYGFSLPADSTATAGTFFFSRRLFTAEGCDSVVTLALTVHANTTGTDVQTACDSYTWIDGIIYPASSDDPQITLRNSHGCDSTVSLHLTIGHSSVSSTTAQASQQYQWRGRTLTESGVYSDTLAIPNAEGCDSVLQLTLSLIPDAPIPIIYCFSRRLIMVDHYPNGENTPRINYRAYRWFHDGTLVPLATSDHLYNRIDRQYLPLSGCYYVEVPAEASATYWVRSNVLCIVGDDDDIRSTSLSVYPNPAASHGSVAIVITESEPESTILLHDAYGRTLYSGPAIDGEHTLPVDISTGIYTVSLRSPQGELVSCKLIVR